MDEGGDSPRVEGPFEYGPDYSAWQLVGTVEATGQCCYSLSAPSNGNTEPGDTCWTYFYVSAHTGRPGESFVSEVVRGFSVDNQSLLDPPDDRPTGPETQPGPPQAHVATLSLPNPNPATDGFDLRYQLVEPVPIDLAVFDVTGRQVARIRKGNAEAGAHLDRWPAGESLARPPAPGIYFARLIAGREVHTVKLILAR